MVKGDKVCYKQITKEWKKGFFHHSFKGAYKTYNYVVSENKSGNGSKFQNLREAYGGIKKRSSTTCKCCENPCMDCTKETVINEKKKANVCLVCGKKVKDKSGDRILFTCRSCR